MTNMTVEELAVQVGGIPFATLIEQLKKAGIEVSSASDKISDEQREQLLKYLEGDNSKPKRISLKRKTKTEIIKVPGKKSVSIVRKSRKIYKELIKEEEPVKEPTQTIENKVEVVEEKKQPIIETKSPDIKGSEQINTTPRKVEEKSFNEDKSKKEKIVPKKDKDKDKDKSTKPKEEIRERKKSKSQILRETQNTGDDYGGHVRRKKSRRPFVKVKEQEIFEINPHGFSKPAAPTIHEIFIPETIKVQELAQKMSIKAAEVIKKLMQLGTMATINQVIDQDTAAILVEELGHKPIMVSGDLLEESIEINYTDAKLEPRAPVVTVMGHVDHGKTSLLDYIRKTKVTSSESGGITQHIGAYRVETRLGKMTFLDTPGHAAFSAMRARGAKCTDLVILVVAADDGVKPQTQEAIQHAKAAGVPIIVAINKIDKHEADIDKVTNEVSQYDLIPESWGGDVIFLPVSAKEGTGIDQLLDAIVLQSDLLELKAPAFGMAHGVVIESRIDKGRGPVASVLIQGGKLKKGDIILAGEEYGRVRTMLSDLGEVIEEAGPSIPVEILGLSGAPKAGDEFIIVPDEKKAREVAAQRQIKQRELKLARRKASSVAGFMDRIKESAVNDRKVLNIVLKTDVQGSLEALTESLYKLSTEEIDVKVIGSGVGGFNESDVNLALASDAILLGFNVRADATARKLAQAENIIIKYHSIIYDAIDEVHSLLLGKLGPKFEERIIGLATVKDVFKSSKIGAIAGCTVTEGIIKRGRPIRVLRDNVVIYEGELESLRRFKEEAAEVKFGTECGIGVKNYNDVRVKDQIEVFEKVEVKREL